MLRRKNGLYLAAAAISLLGACASENGEGAGADDETNDDSTSLAVTCEVDAGPSRDA